MKLPRVWFRNDAQMQPQVSPDGRWMYRVVNPAQNEYEVRVTRIVSTTGADSVLDESIKPFHFTAQSIQKLIPWSPDSGAFAVVSADRVNAQDTSGRVFIFEPTSVTGVLSPIGVLTVAKMMPATAWTPSGGALGIGDGDDILVFTRTNTSSIRVQASLSTPSLKWQQSDRLFALAFGGLRQSATLAALFDPLHPADGLTAFTIEDRRAVVLGGQTDTLPFLLVCEEVRDTQAISHRLALFNVETGESRPLGELRQPATCTFMKSATAPLSHYTLIQSELGNNTDDANLWLFDWQRMHLQSLGRVERLLSYNTSDAAQGFAVVVEQPDGFWLERIRPTQ